MEASPLSHGDVPAMLSCLLQALSTDPRVQKHAEESLVSLEGRPGFCSCLAEVISDKAADHSARWLASVHLKNSVNRLWRVRSDQRGISSEEKAHLRGKAMQLIPQDDSQIAVQISLVFAKVARFDFPKEWPHLFTELLQHAIGGSTLMTRRVYLVLHHVLKELATKRLAEDRKCFEQTAQTLFGHVWERWCADATELLAGLPALLGDPDAAAQPPAPVGQSAGLLQTFERWLLLLKILRRLILHGYSSDARSLQPVPAVNLCAPAMVQVLQQMLALRPRRRVSGGPPQRHHLAAMMDRAMVKLIKCQRQVLEVHPWSYQAANMLLPLIDFCCAQLTSGGGGGHAVATAAALAMGVAPAATNSSSSGSGERPLAFEGFWVECTCFLVAALTHSSFKVKGSEQAKAMAKEVQASMAALWSAERLTTLARALVLQYMPLTAKDLESWSSSPEEFHHASDSGGWHEHLNLAAEHLFLILLTAHRDVLAPLVVQLLHLISTPRPPGTTPADQLVAGIPGSVLLKDAVYNAVAVGAYELHDHLDFAPWLRSTLMQELNDRSPTNKLIRRRITKIVGNCVARLSVEDRPPLYNALVTLLAEDDACLQLCAVDCLRALVDDWNFTEAQFAPAVAPTLSLLVRMVAASSELDTQTQAFSLMNLVIERMFDTIRPFVKEILALLPQLWTDAEGQSLLRIQILLALQRLLNVLGPESASAYHIVLPILQYSLDITQPESLNLLEDGLALWLTALRNAAAVEPSLLALFPALPAVMAASTEHIQTGMQILTSCALLSTPALLQHHGVSVAAMLEGLIGNVTERGMLLILPAMELLIQSGHEHAVQTLQGPLVKLLALVLKDEDSFLTAALAMPVFARCILHAPSAFMGLFSTASALGVAVPAAVSSAPAALLSPPERLFDALLDLWIERVDSVAAPLARKTCALALCALLALPTQAVLLQLDGIVSSVTSVWHQQEGGGNGTRVIIGEDYVSIARPGAEDIMEGNAAAAAGAGAGSEEADGEAARRAALTAADPVPRMTVSAALREQLQACAALHGQRFHDAMATMDASIAGQLKAAVGMA